MEWFNDSLKIDSFHYWMNQCFWMNDSMTRSRLTRFITEWISAFEWMIQWLAQDWLVSLLNESVLLDEWFKDSLKIDSLHYWMNQCFWMNDSKTNTCLTAPFHRLNKNQPYNPTADGVWATISRVFTLNTADSWCLEAGVNTCEASMVYLRRSAAATPARCSCPPPAPATGP